MDRDEFMNLVYDELHSDGDNNRANRIIEAADEYVEYSLAKQSAQLEPSEDDPRADVYYLAEKIGIHQLYALVVQLCEELEPCEDVVSRKAVKEQMLKYGFLAPDMTVTEFVEDCLPPVTPKQKWIPVTEGLPKELDVVLMTVYRTDKRYNQYPYFRIGYIQSGEWYPVPQTQPPFESSLSRHDGGDPVVTAWMPLPQPYKGR